MLPKDPVPEPPRRPAALGRADDTTHLAAFLTPRERQVLGGLVPQTGRWLLPVA